MKTKMYPLLLAALACSAMPVSALNLYLKTAVDLSSTANGVNPEFIGSLPSAVVWNGTDAWVAGYNASGVIANTAIVKISSVLTTPTLGTAFGVLSTPNSRGHTSLALSGNNLLAAYDNGAGSADSIRMFDASTATQVWRIGDSSGDSTRRGNGCAFDPGYIAGGSPVSAAAFLTLGGSGRRHRLDTVAGTYLDGQNSGAIINFSPTSTTWRDLCFDPATGDLYTRESNRVGKANRDADNHFVGGASSYIGTVTASGVVDQENIAFMDLTGQGPFLIFNDRSVTSSGQSFSTVVKLFDTNGTPQTLTWDTIPFATGNGAYDFSWDAASGTLAISDSLNRRLYIYGLTPSAPAIAVQPVGITNLLQGGFYTLSVSVSGAAPFTNQWKLYGTNLPGATNTSLLLTNVALTASGDYSFAATNASGFALSTTSTVVVIPSVLTSAAQPLWSMSVGDLFFLGNDNNCRGVAYNALSNHLIVVSRTGSNGVHVLNADTGAYIRSLDMSAVVNVGTFPVNLVGCGDDGAVYVANLDVAGLSYKIYRWADDGSSTVATSAYGAADPGVGGRIGDTFAVRGAGTSTEILAASSAGTTIALFTTSDGSNFNPTVIDTAPEPAGLAGLGLAFGAGDTFWTKNSGYQFRHIAFDLTASTNGLLQTFAAGQTTSVGLAVDSVNDLLVGIVPNTGAGTRPRPDNLELYNVHDLLSGAAASPTLIDQEFFKTSNVNGNGATAAAFDVNGGRLFALDANNGLAAFKVVARLNQAGNQLSWTGPSILQGSTNIVGTYVDIPAAPSPHTVGGGEGPFFRLKR